VSADDAGRRPTISPELWRPDGAGKERARSFLWERPRQLTLLGCLATVAGMLIQPYAAGSEFEGTTTRISITDVADAGYVIVFSALLAALMLSRGAAESRLRIVALAPPIMAVASAAILGQIIGMLLRTTGHWLSGSISWGVWLAAIGAAAAVVGAIWLLVRRWPATVAQSRSPAIEGVATERVGSGSSREAVGVFVGGSAGFVLALGVSSSGVVAGTPLGGLVTILVLSVGGAWLGSILGRRLGLG
jgi:hypothetical protein